MRNFLAMACCVATFSATAQSTVTVAGVVDAFAGRMRMAGDLGDGLRAIVKLTSFFRTDSGASGRFDGDPFFQRDANVALSGGFGAVTLGRSQAPNMGPSILSNPFAESFMFSPLILHSNVNTASWSRRTTPADTGWNNQVVCTTPTFGGFRTSLHYQFGEQANGAAGDGLKNLGVSAYFFRGPLTLTGYYERDQVTNPGNSAPITTPIGGVNVPTTKK